MPEEPYFITIRLHQGAPLLADDGPGRSRYWVRASPVELKTLRRETRHRERGS